MDVFDLFAKIRLDSSDYDRSLQNASSAAEQWATKFTMAAKAVGAGISTVVKGITSITTQSVQNYSSYQQLIGGVETLFGTQGKSFEDWSETFKQSSDGMEDYIDVARKVINGDFGKGADRKDLLAQAGYDPDTVQQMVNNLINGIDVASNISADEISANMQTAEEKYASLERAQSKAIENAHKAYQTAGMSANEYMETVTSFAASLNQALGGDTEASVAKADMALQDMSDNANKMGTSMQSLQMAYNGFAKQNYTMLDNLKLGYGGTKSEMERLLADAQKLTGVKYNISNLADVYDAIHAIQVETGIYKTTAEEAEKTIEGSTKMMKASWQNVLTSLVTGGDFFKESLDGLIDSVQIFARNIVPAIQGALQGVGALISGVAPVLLGMLPGMVEELLPGLIDAVISVIDGILDALPDLLKVLETVTPMLTSSLSNFVPSIIDFLVEGIPQFVSTGLKMLTSLVSGLTDNIPTIVPQLTQGMIDIVDQLINIVETDGANLASAGLSMLSAFADALVQAVPSVLTQVTQLVQDLTASISNAASGENGNILTASTTILSNLVDGLMTSIPTLIPQLTEAVSEFVTQFANLASSNSVDFANSAVAILDSLITSLSGSIPEVMGDITDAVMAIIDAIANVIENFDVVKFANAAVTLVVALADGIVKSVDKITEKLPELITGLVAWLTNPANLVGIADAALTLFGELVSKVPDILISLGEGLAGIVTGIKDYFANHGGEILDGLKNGFAGIAEKMQETWNEKIKPAFDQLGEKLKGFFLQFDWGQTFLDFVKKIGDAISGAWDNIKNAFSGENGLGAKIGSWLKEIDLLQAAKNLIESLKNGISSAWDGISSWFTDKFTHLFDNIDLSKLKFWEKWGKKDDNGETVESSNGEETTVDMPSGMLTLDYSKLEPIPEEVLASYQMLADAINSINSAISGGGQSVEGAEGASAEGAEGAEGAGQGLMSALSGLPELFMSVQSAAQSLAEYLAGDFVGSIMAMLQVVCQTSTDENGNVNAGGGNTLYTALGAVFGLFQDILATSRSLAEHWTGEFIAASLAMRKEAGNATSAASELAGAASGAAGEFANWALQIWAVVDALDALSGAQSSGKGKGKSSGVVAGAAAIGAHVNAGETWLVGEKGPELFTPSRSGYVIPNKDIRGSSQEIKVEINGNIYGDAYLKDYVVDLLTGTIRKEMKLAS